MVDIGNNYITIVYQRSSSNESSNSNERSDRAIEGLLNCYRFYIVFKSSSWEMNARCDIVMGDKTLFQSH